MLFEKKICWDAVVLAQDWHPAKHMSFCTANILEGRYCRMGDSVELPSGIQQKMWPDHCIQNSDGADFPVELDYDADDILIQKGTDVNLDSYSAFLAVDGVTTTELHKKLVKLNVTDVYIVGLGTEYGVGATALDAKRLGFNTHVVVDGTKGYNDETTKSTHNQLEAAGVIAMSSTVLLQWVDSKEDKRQQAAIYMEKHNIHTLFQTLCTALVYNTPEEPKTFLVKELQRLQKQKQSELSKISLLSDEDLETMFHMLDPIKTGTLSSAQVKKAINGLGLKLSSEIGDNEFFNITKFKQLFLAAK